MTTLRAGQSALLAAAVARALDTAGIDYVVIGAMAAAVHGVVRASVDADLLAATSVAGARDLASTLASHGLATELRRGDPADPIGAVLAIVDDSGNRVDVLIGLRGADPGLFQRAIGVRLHGADLRIVGLEDFVAMKAFAGGPVDLLDAQRAIAAAGDDLDVELLRRLAAGFGRDAAAAVERLLAG